MEQPMTSSHWLTGSRLAGLNTVLFWPPDHLVFLAPRNAAIVWYLLSSNNSSPLKKFPNPTITSCSATVGY